MISIEKIFPLVLIIIDIVAGAIYFCQGDVKRAIYWVAAATLTYTVTF